MATQTPFLAKFAKKLPPQPVGLGESALRDPKPTTVTQVSRETTDDS